MLKNTREQYGSGAKFLHWTIALIIISLWIVGHVMAGMDNTPTKFQVFFFHKSFGIAVLMLFVVRICWRLINTQPALDGLSAFQRFAANAVHWALYFCMFAMPMTGWLLSSSAGRPVSFFGLFTLPDLVPVDKEASHIYAERHEQISWLLLALFLAHVGAALMHHFIYKDGILKRMLPNFKK